MGNPLTTPELHNVALQNRAATGLLYVATQDYAAARCLALNLLLGSLVMGAQAMEKYLKAFVLMHEPARNVRSLGHDLPELLKEADRLVPKLRLSQYDHLAQTFNGYYQARYPENPRPTSMTTEDIVALDDFVVVLNENLPCPKSLRCRTGLYADITFSLGYKATVTPTEYWIKAQNRALAPLLPRIEADYHEVMNAL